MASGIVHGQSITIENKNIAYSLPAGTDSVWHTDTNFTKDGYKLIGIVGCALNNNYVHIVNLAPNNPYGFLLRNLTNSAISETAILTLLWRKN